MPGTTAYKKRNVNDHILNRIIQQQLARDSVKKNSPNFLKKVDTKLKLYHVFVYFICDMPYHDV